MAYSLPSDHKNTGFSMAHGFFCDVMPCLFVIVTDLLKECLPSSLGPCSFQEHMFILLHWQSVLCTAQNSTF